MILIIYNIPVYMKLTNEKFKELFKNKNKDIEDIIREYKFTKNHLIFKNNLITYQNKYYHTKKKETGILKDYLNTLEIIYFQR